MSIKVLLADDSPTIKKVFELSLKDYEPEILIVSEGDEILAEALDFRPDIFFIDVLLSKGNGYSASKKLKKTSEFGPVPVVLLKSQFMEQNQDQFEDSMADLILEKPFDVEDLRQILRDHVPEAQTNLLGSEVSFPESVSRRLTPTESLLLGADFKENPPAAMSQNLAPNPTPSTSMDILSHETSLDSGLPPDLNPDLELLDLNTSTSNNIEISEDLLDSFENPRPAHRPQEQKSSSESEVLDQNLDEWDSELDELSEFRIENIDPNEEPPLPMDLNLSELESEQVLDPNLTEFEDFSLEATTDIDSALLQDNQKNVSNTDIETLDEISFTANIENVDLKPETTDFQMLEDSQDSEPLDSPAPTTLQIDDLNQDDIADITHPIFEKLSTDELRLLIRKECHSVIEKAVYELVPEISKTLITKELKRLLAEDN